MYRAKNVFWMIGLYWLAALGIYGQAQRPTDIRTGGDSTSALKSVEPDIPGTTLTISTGSQAVVPRLMKFSGALRDAAGKPLTGTVDVTFSLYNTEAGGEPLWFETQSVQADDLGRYTALLGAMHTDGLPVDLFTSGEVRWLGLQVGLEAEQQPRVLLVSVPYALKAGDAETLGGKPASAYVLADGQNGTATGTTTTSTSGAAPAGTKDMTDKSGKTNVSPLVAVCSTITSNAGGTVNSIPMFTATCNIENSVITQSGSNIGIGTPSPVDTLVVQGPSNSGVSVYGGGNQQGGFRWNPFSGGYLFLEDPSVSNPVALVGSGLSYMKGGHLSLGSSTDVSELQVTGASGASAGAAGNGIEELTTGTGLSTDNRLQFGIVDGSYGWIQSLKPGTGYHNLVLEPGGGNVGIGQTLPAATLDVNGTANFSGLVTFAAGQTITGNVSTTAQLVSTVTTGTAPLSVASTTQVPNLNASLLGGVPASGYALLGAANTFTGSPQSFSGSVGIGTTTPAHTLDVVGDIRAYLGMNVDGLGVNDGALTDGLIFGNSSGEGMASKRTAGGNQFGLDFYTEFADRMSIRQTGQVGIGTSNPYTTLHLRGDVAGGLGPTLLLMNGGAGGNAGASIDFDGYDPGSGNPPSARMQSYDDGNFSSHLSFQTKVPGGASNALVEQARITSTGSLIVDSSGQNTGSLSGSTAGGAGLIFGGSGSGEGIASCRGNCSNSGGYWPNSQYSLDFFTADQSRLIIANDGTILIDTCTFWSNSDHQGPCSSDARLKYNIKPLSPVLDKLALLRPVHFNYRTAEYPDYHFPRVRMTGLIAQDVEKVFPELVSTDARGFRTLDSGPLQFMLLEGVRELKTRNDTLRQQVGEQQVQLRQAREQSRAQQVAIRKLSGQVRKLTQDQTEIAALKARLDRLEAGESSTLRAQASQARKSKQSAHSEVARARF